MNNQRTFTTNSLVRLTLVVTMMACSVLCKLQWERYRATKQWKQAAFTFPFNEASAISMYKEVYPTLAYKGEFLYNYGAELSEANYAVQGVYILEQAKNKFNHLDLHLYLGKGYQEMGDNLKAEQAYHHAMHMVPHRFLPKYLLVKLYQETGECEKAIAMANLILNMKEKVPSDVTREIKIEMKKFLLEKDHSLL